LSSICIANYCFIWFFYNLNIEFRLCAMGRQWCGIFHTTDEQLQYNRGCYFPIQGMLPGDFPFHQFYPLLHKEPNFSLNFLVSLENINLFYFHIYKNYITCTSYRHINNHSIFMMWKHVFSVSVSVFHRMIVLPTKRNS